MVIGSFFSRRPTGSACLVALALGLLILPSRAEDQIMKNNGTVVSGKILGASSGQVMIESHASNGSVAKFPISISDIKSVSMSTPSAVTAAQGAAPDAVIAALEPVVKQFAGLPADWVVDAMAQLADAYMAQNHTDLALALYNQIDTLYPKSKYQAQAVAGRALISLKAGKVDEALATIQPIIAQADKDLAPSPSDSAVYARAYLVYGEALEAQKKLKPALEAYLTVTTMFYRSPDAAADAQQHAKSLRDQNPGLGVD